MYSKIFTLKDIFNNKKLRGKLPLINYKESVDSNGKTHKTTHLKSVSYVVYDSAKTSARQFYKPLKASKTSNTIIIDGNLVGDYESAVDKIYTDLLGKVSLIKFTANSGDLIRSALKFSEKQLTKPKLYLRQNSMLGIESLNSRQLEAFLDNVLENIFYSDSFAEIQEKYKLRNIAYDYETRKLQWQRRVGEI